MSPGDIFKQFPRQKSNRRRPGPGLSPKRQWDALPGWLYLGKPSPSSFSSALPGATVIKGREWAFVRELRTYRLGWRRCGETLFTKRKENGQFPSILDPIVACLLALCQTHANPGFTARCWIQALPPGSSQPGGGDRKE